MIELLTPPAVAEPAPASPPPAADRDGPPAFAAVLEDATVPSDAPSRDAQPGHPTLSLPIEGEETPSPIAQTNPSPFDGGGQVGATAPETAAVTQDLLQLVKLPTLPTGFVAQKSPTEPVDDDSADSGPTETADAPLAPVPLPIFCAPAPPLPAAAPIQSFKAALETVASRAKAEPAKADAPSADVASAVQQALTATPAPVVPQPLDAATADKSAPAPVTAAAATTVALDDLMVTSAPDSGWLDRLAGDIVTLGNGDSREATLKISPRALGDMAIKLDMEGHRARVHFTVDTPQALTLMADGAPRLAALVEANGLKLDGATVDLNQRRDQRAPQPPEPPRLVARARTEIARMLGRTRIATATERFA